MPEDQPVVVTGGSLTVKSKKKLKEKGKKGDREEYDVDDPGELIAVDIDGTRHPARKDSTVTIITNKP